MSDDKSSIDSEMSTTGCALFANDAKEEIGMNHLNMMLIDSKICV